MGCTSRGNGAEGDPPTVLETAVRPSSSASALPTEPTSPGMPVSSMPVSNSASLSPLKPSTGLSARIQPPVTSVSTLLPAPAAPSLTPTQVLVPALGIDSRLGRLRLTRDGRLSVPSNPQDVGWYRARGPLVVIGHVDSETGPAIFYRLRDLRPGSRIDLQMSDGRTNTYEVEEIVAVKKTQFPTARVYGSGESVRSEPDLRLVTCGGSFDRSAGHYRSNIIVFARYVPPFK